MMSNILLDEITDTHCVTLLYDAKDKEFVAEVFIRDKGFLWYSVLRYASYPSLATLIRNTYVLNCKSPRPYKAGQPNDGSVTAPVLHQYGQVCIMLNLDPLALYNEAYDDRVLTADQFRAIIEFAQWQGVEILDELSPEILNKVLESVRELDMHELASVLEDKLPILRHKLT